MVQFFQGREDPRAAQWAGVGSALGEGIGGGLNAYFSNKALDAVAQDPANKDLPLSEKFAKLQQAASPYGPSAEKRLNQRMQYMEQENTRGLLQNALKGVDDLVKSGASPSEIALGAAKAFAGIPGGDRLAQAVLPTMLNQAAATRRYGPQNKQQPPGQPPQGNKPSPYSPFGSGPQNQMQGIPAAQNQQQPPGQPPQIQQVTNQNATQQQNQPPRYSAYNIPTPDQMKSDAKEEAYMSGNPDAYETILAQKEKERNLATEHRQLLENTAQTKGKITDEEMAPFMKVAEAQNIPSENVNEWLENAKRAWAPVKDDFSKMADVFIPGLGSGLLGRDRNEALERIIPLSQDLIAKGREPELRSYLTEQYLSPVEVEGQIHPPSKQLIQNLDKLPNGLFKAQKVKPSTFDIFSLEEKEPTGENYEKIKKSSPETMQNMQNKLSDFLLNNVKDDTSLEVLRHKLWSEKDYDWRQIGPAFEQAKRMGLKLNPNQSTELANISTNPPIESLPDLFRDWSRLVQNLRGNK
jgi:hypothetical protein